jgi:O-antigen ligase
VRRAGRLELHRWDLPASGKWSDENAKLGRNWPVVVLGTLNLSILAFCFISAVNAKGAFLHEPLNPTMYSTQVTHDNFIPWLPHSYDATATWWIFTEYLGLSLVFWAARDWLLGKTRAEAQSSIDEGLTSQFLTARMRRLLWVVCINGGLLALEGTMQKLSGTTKSLWISEPRILKAAIEQFGPWAYRSNGAAYVNLVWPVCLGFWWGLHNAENKRGGVRVKFGQGASIALFPCVIVLGSCPFISSSAFLGLIAAMVVIMRANRGMGWKLMLLPALVGVLVLGVAGYLGFEDLAKRFEELKVNETGGRAPIYRNAHKMAEDTPVFGLGPGSFMTLYQFYRDNITDDWAAMAHDDYLETRITFGWIGFALILALVPALAAHVWRGRGIPCDWQFIALLWISLAGCMAHAKFDFPFQIHSILGMFLTVCCLQSCLVRQR